MQSFRSSVVERLETMRLEELIQAGDFGHKMLGGGNVTFGKLGCHLLYPGIGFSLNSAKTNE